MNRIVWIFLIFQCLFGQVTIPDKPNPHNDSSCDQCHTSLPATLVNYNKGACESCHITLDIELHHKHPVKGPFENSKNITIPNSLPLDGNNFSCNTCHKMTCESRIEEDNLLRKTIFMKESDFCYQCHDQSQYQKLNPHIQFTQDSELIESTCVECHNDVPDKNGNLDLIHDDVYQKSALCIKCHHLPNHEIVHMNKVIDTANPVYQTYKQSVSDNSQVLPLSPANEIKCFTCHYSHENGVTNNQKVVYDYQQSNPYFLRLPNVKTCMACHEI